MRGDHRSEANQIDIDVIKSVQESDLCICNLSEPNINVYYELGRRDETGKPVVLMKSKRSASLPMDIATRRYIEFDLTDPQGILDAMIQLQYRMDKMRFYDVVVEQVAAIGSRKAGQMLVDFAQEFFDGDMSFKKKTEYLGCLASYASRTDTALEIVELVERLCDQLEGICNDEAPGDVVQIYNQPNRLYCGIYTTDDEAWLDKAIEALQKALRITQQGFLYFNLALCVSKKRDYEAAARYIGKCLEIDDQAGKNDVDHLELACEMYNRTGAPKFQDTFSRLQNVSSGKAMLLMRKLRNLCPQQIIHVIASRSLRGAPLDDIVFSAPHTAGDAGSWHLLRRRFGYRPTVDRTS